MDRFEAGARTLTRAAALAFGLALAAMPARAASPPVAALALPDASGKPASLAGYRGKPVVVFFFRGFWCAYCVEQLVLLEKLKATDLKDIPVLAVSPDGPNAVARGIDAVGKERGVRLTPRFLCDEDAVFRDRYGLAGDASKPGPKLPTMLLLDAEGRDVWRYGESHYQKRSFDASLRAALAALPRAGQTP
ncbi:MAG: TlpA disulfide reductase family protein [Acidobacteriota bacterium]